MAQDKSDEIPWIPELAGDYDLIRELGRGGTAVVYLARERELGRDVAIKLIRPAYVRDEDAVARLVREARTVGKLQHPSIVMLLGTRRLGDGGLALILQYVPGATLKERIQEGGPLSFTRMEQVLRDLGQALTYAHAHRIVHRDIKPENVYLDDVSGLTRLADFGLARGWDSDSGLTMPGTAIGTPTYMSPEQIEGRELDGRSDLYSLGLVGYEALTGRQPWAGESLYSIIFKQKNEELPPIAKLRPDTPPNLIAVIEGSIRKNPDERWRNAHEFLSALAGRISRPTGSSALPARVDEVTSPRPARLSVPAGGPPPVPGTPHARTGGPWRSRRISGPAKKSGPSRRRLARSAVVVAVLVVTGTLALAFAAPEGRVATFLGSMASFAADLGSAPDPALQGMGGGVPPSGGVGSDVSDPFPVGEVDGAPTATVIGPGGPSSAGTSTGSPRALLAVDGNDQVGVYGAALPLPLDLRLVDEGDSGVEGVPVILEVLSGGGLVEPARGVTDGEGRFTARWTLGTGSPEQIIRARTEETEPVEAVLRAEARTPFPQRTEVVAGPNQQAPAGTELPSPLELRVLDAVGNPFEGAVVRFLVASGGGRVEPGELVTDMDGLASARWTLGPNGGAQAVVAEVAGITGGAVTFQANATVPTLGVTPSVVVGGTHSCSLRSDGEVVCWGANDRGQLGDGSRSARLIPSLTVQGERFAAIASGLSHACALTTEGRAFCWGANDQGQLGVTLPAQSQVPTSVAGTERFTMLTAGIAHSCGITATGQAYCWGANESGQLGDGSRQGRTSPFAVQGGFAFRQLAAGWRHTCGVTTDGSAYCWGDNDSGQLGSDESTGGATPVPVSGGHRFERIAAGNTHTCGLTIDGNVLCWGTNASGQLGDGTTEPRLTPRPIDSDERFSAVTAGGVHTCALNENGAARCWGRNLYGQLGDGTTQDRQSPTAVSGNDRFSQIQALGSHNCARTPSGAVLCWGYNLDGQLGDGTRQNRSSPTPVTSARP